MKFVHKHFFKLSLFILPLYILVTIVIGMIAPLSFMAFDAPESIEHVVTWLFVLSMFGLAFSFFISDILIAIFALKKKRRALIISLLLPSPFILILLFIFIFQPNF